MSIGNHCSMYSVGNSVLTVRILLCLESKQNNLSILHHCLTNLMFQCDALFSSDASDVMTS